MARVTVEVAPPVAPTPPPTQDEDPPVTPPRRVSAKTPVDASGAGVVDLDEADVAVKRVRVQGSGARENIVVNAESLRETPTQIAKPKGTSISFFEISIVDEVGRRVEVDGATITLSVAKPLPEGVLASHIIVQHHDGAAWTLLATTLISESANAYIFEAETPGFSPFAITADEEAPAIDARVTPKAVSGAWSDDLAGVDTSSLVVTLDGTRTLTCTLVSQEGFACALPEGLVGGDHEVVVRVLDNLGREATRTLTFSTPDGAIPDESTENTEDDGARAATTVNDRFDLNSTVILVGLAVVIAVSIAGGAVWRAKRR